MITYIINRKDRPERLANALMETSEQLLQVNVFNAIISKPGWKGCRDSHLAIMERCKNEKIFMILEDDIVFLDNFSLAYINALMELPKDWDCLFLGASPQEPFKRYSPHLFKMGRAYTTHAIVWHNRHNGAVEHILSHKSGINKIDVYFADYIFPRFNCFIIYPMLVTQRQYQSDTCTRSDVSTILKNYNLYCK